ncbi:SUKH-3 immunity protein of toxin-antitoxin system [Lentzea atacamensis]|uniref:SUKH-3 immunity protein of toxin-antitoxin system n=1 Tax=Lentzea atacamensis TaxID=531938 RepID=A0A316IMV7_9PSEU|nr:SUKH-3 domain-containing protein [Lentzea atacamensis]PWK91798.1 SUKH-3 immunity protein of toxin-antitoxin system [Lentzea atacamensis]
MNQENSWPDGLYAELVRVGWTPDRRVDTEVWRADFETEGVQMFPAVEEFLSRFGGLVFEQRENGVDSDCFQFELDPDLCRGDGQLFIEWGESLGKGFYPLGEFDRGRFYLAMDSDGVIYRVTDELATFGRGVEGLAALVLGVASKPLPLK